MSEQHPVCTLIRMQQVVESVPGQGIPRIGGAQRRTVDWTRPIGEGGSTGACRTSDYPVQSALQPIHRAHAIGIEKGSTAGRGTKETGIAQDDYLGGGCGQSDLSDQTEDSASDIRHATVAFLHGRQAGRGSCQEAGAGQGRESDVVATGLDDHQIRVTWKC